MRAGETDETLPLRLVAEPRRPRDARRAKRAAGPTCIGEEESAHASMTIESRGRTLDLALDGVGNLAVREGSRLLWRRHVGSAGGAMASTACSSNGWGVVIAGHYRHGEDVFDLFSGKKLGPGGVAAYAPDLSYALAPPAFWFGGDCYSWSRTFRIPTDGSSRPYALATPPVPAAWTCNEADEPKASATPPSDRPSVAISEDSARYAISTARELAVYRASDDVMIARYLRPPYKGYDRTTNDTALAFATTGDALVLSRSVRGSYDGPTYAAEEHWFTLRARSPQPPL
ncbi:MAG: hypothetical protein U0414_26490 [Polyangiaceae bacterium]